MVVVSWESESLWFGVLKRSSSLRVSWGGWWHRSQTAGLVFVSGFVGLWRFYPDFADILRNHRGGRPLYKINAFDAEGQPLTGRMTSRNPGGAVAGEKSQSPWRKKEAGSSKGWGKTGVWSEKGWAPMKGGFGWKGHPSFGNYGAGKSMAMPMFGGGKGNLKGGKHMEFQPPGREGNGNGYGKGGVDSAADTHNNANSNENCHSNGDNVNNNGDQNLISPDEVARDWDFEVSPDVPPRKLQYSTSDNQTPTVQESKPNETKFNDANNDGNNEARKAAGTIVGGAVPAGASDKQLDQGDGEHDNQHDNQQLVAAHGNGISNNSSNNNGSNNRFDMSDGGDSCEKGNGMEEEGSRQYPSPSKACSEGYDVGDAMIRRVLATQDE
jgi:hypothetical protein